MDGMDRYARFRTSRRPAKQEMPRSPHALADGASEDCSFVRAPTVRTGRVREFPICSCCRRSAPAAAASDLDIGVTNGPLRRSAGQDHRIDITGKFDTRSNVRDIGQIIICIETRQEACAVRFPDEKVMSGVQQDEILDDGPLLRGRESQNLFQHLSGEKPIGAVEQRYRSNRRKSARRLQQTP